MILPRGPNLGKMLVYIGRPLAFLFAFDLVVAVAYVVFGWKWISLPEIPLGTFGGAIGVIVGFRNTSSYQRWWEARTLWGSIVNHSRALARQAITFISGPEDIQRRIVHYQIAWVHALRCHLRQQPPWEDLARVLPADELQWLRGRQNVPAAIHEKLAGACAECFREGWLDSIRWSAMDETLTALVNAQGGAERIKNTPMPKQYDYYPYLFVQTYCLLLPIGMVSSLGLLTPVGSTLLGFVFLALDKIGRDLEHPFDNTINDIPMTAISRTIEINLRQSLGESEVPEAHQPVGGILW